MAFKTWLVAIPLLALTGCATSGAGRLSFEAEAGRAYARRACAGCHAVEAGSPSPHPRAPSFLDIAGLYDDRQLASEFDALGRLGHYEMPPVAIAEPDRRALAAYISRLALSRSQSH